MAFELDDLNLVSRLARSGIASLSEDRNMPLVVAGGMFLFMKPKALASIVTLRSHFRNTLRMEVG